MFIFAIFLIILVLILQQHSNQETLQGLDAQLTCDKRLVEIDEDFFINIELENRKFRILPFLKLRIYLPSGFAFPKLKKGNISKATAGGQELILTTWLLPKQKLKMNIPCILTKRGRYFTNGMQICSGDFLGLKESSNRYDDFVELVCLPKEKSLPQKIENTGGFLGEISVKRFIFEDPTLTIGFREYTGREAMKRISWTRSAKAGHLMVKEMDYTQETSVMVVLNIDSDGINRDENIENAYSLARYVCHLLEEQRMNYAFSCNAISMGNLKSWKYVSEGLGKTHFGFILEGLGRAGYAKNCDFKSLLNESVKRACGSFGVIFITSGDDKGQCQFARLCAQKSSIQVFCIDAGRL